VPILSSSEEVLSVRFTLCPWGAVFVAGATAWDAPQPPTSCRFRIPGLKGIVDLHPEVTFFVAISITFILWTLFRGVYFFAVGSLRCLTSSPGRIAAWGGCTLLSVGILAGVFASALRRMTCGPCSYSDCRLLKVPKLSVYGVLCSCGQGGHKNKGFTIRPFGAVWGFVL
jgi:hypothetical protein